MKKALFAVLAGLIIAAGLAPSIKAGTVPIPRPVIVDCNDLLDLISCKQCRAGGETDCCYGATGSCCKVIDQCTTKDGKPC